MTTEREQSAIKEVRDQLSLDFADGEYLTALSSNLGLDRPVFSFSDATWRAVSRVLAVNYKQIRLKFEQFLEIILGPKKTRATTLAEDSEAGSQTIVLTDVTLMPQVGILVLDEGLPNEESVEYEYIDRYSNTVYLTVDTLHSHSSYSADESTVLVTPHSSSDTELLVLDSLRFPTSDFPHTLLLSPGTDHEEVVELTANDTSNGILTVSPLVNSHPGMTPEVIQTELSVSYGATSNYLVCDDTSQFPAEGIILTGASNEVFDVVSATTSSVTCAASSFTEGRIASCRVVFEGNITSALADVEATVKSNTDDTLSLASTLVTSPAAGDRFQVRVRERYIRNEYEDNILLLSRPFPTELTYPVNTEVELDRGRTTVSLAQAQVKGVFWDVYQTEPKEVHLVIPELLNDEGTVRSASYLHDEWDSGTPSTTTSGSSSAGDTTLPVNDTSDFPVAGTVLLDSGGGNEEYVFFTKSRLTDTVDTSGTTGTTINLTTGGLTPSAYVGLLVTIEGIGTTVVTSNGSSSVELAVPLSDRTVASLEDGVTVVEIEKPDELAIPRGLVNSHSSSESVDLHQPRYGSTDLLDGDIWGSSDHIWPGPYVYEETSRVATAGEGGNTLLATKLAGPDTVEVSSVPGNTAIEVSNASDFPLSGFPYDVRVGVGTGNVETTAVNSVSLKQRTTTTVASSVTPGDTEIEVASLGSGAGGFPDSGEYRVLLARGTVSEEVILVSGTDTGPDRLLCSAVSNSFSGGETVELLADVLSVDALTNYHDGIVTYGERSSLWPVIKDYNRTDAESVYPLYESFDLTSSSGFPTDGGYLYLNFGGNNLGAKDSLASSLTGGSSTTMTLNDSSDFPTTYPYSVTVGKGKATEEIVTVTNNNTGTGVLTFTDVVRLDHGADEKVVFVAGDPEVVYYDEIDGNEVRFTSPVTVESTHHLCEYATSAQAKSLIDSTGYTFLFRMPPDLLFRIQTVLDRIRAAGINLLITNNR